MSVPSSELGPPPPTPQASVSPPLRPKGGQHSLAGKGVGVQFGRLDRKVGALYTLWAKGRREGKEATEGTEGGR